MLIVSTLIIYVLTYRYNMNSLWKTYDQYSRLKPKYSFAFYFLVTFLSLSIIASIPIWSLITQYNKGNLEIIRERELGYLNTASQSIQRDFFGMIANVGVISRAPIINKFLTEGDVRDGELVTDLMIAMAENYQRYNQVRILNINGNEVIRVNYKDGKSTLIKTEDLQNKSLSDYFQKTLSLNEGGVYLSPLELNIEHGEIEIPHQPTIKVAAPLFDKLGVKKGIFIVDYDAFNLINNFKRILQKKDSHIGMLINSESFYLIGENETNEFGFMLKNENLNLRNQFPKVWDALINSEKKHLLTDQGLFLFDTVHPLKREVDIIGKQFARPVGISEAQANNYRWHIVLQVPEKELRNSYFFGNKVALFILMLVYCLLGLVSALVSIVMMKTKIQLSIERDAFLEMQSLAQVDGLTNTYNRRFFCELAERELARIKRSQESLSLMMLDIDYFKKINDIYGHDVGDQAIKSFCLVCKKMLRELDILGRMGGEEFAVLMPQTTITQAESVAERLRKAVSEVVLDLPEGKISFTVSIGITCTEPSNYDLNVMLKDADKAMYMAKNNGRNQISVNENINSLLKSDFNGSPRY